MPRRLKVSDEARGDLNQARGWLHQPGSGKVAHGRYKALTAAIRTVRTEPMRYRVNPEDDSERIVSVEGYRIIYKVTPDTGDNETAATTKRPATSKSSPSLAPANRSR